MAKFTFSLRELIETYGKDEVKSWFSAYKLEDYLKPEEIEVLNQGNWTKDKLASRIISHFYLREACTDSVGNFRRMVMDKMEEVMEEYLPLIYSAAIKYDPLVNVDFTETFHRDSQDQTNASSNTIQLNKDLTISSDTPQGQINRDEILSGKYASSTSALDTNDQTNAISDASNQGSEDYVKTTKGNSGVSATAQKMVQQYRENIVAINRDIIKAISPLFFGIY